jgi:hypothetical protein
MTRRIRTLAVALEGYAEQAERRESSCVYGPRSSRRKFTGQSNPSSRARIESTPPSARSADPSCAGVEDLSLPQRLVAIRVIGPDRNLKSDGLGPRQIFARPRAQHRLQSGRQGEYAFNGLMAHEVPLVVGVYPVSGVDDFLRQLDAQAVGRLLVDHDVEFARILPGDRTGILAIEDADA